MNQDLKKTLSFLYDIFFICASYVFLCALVSLFWHAPFSLMLPLNAVKVFKLNPPTGFIFAVTLSGILMAIILGFNPFRRGGSYGEAHFATEREIKKNLKLRANKGVVLGTKRLELLQTDEPLSVLVYAPPGSGKTAGLIIPSLLCCENSALVHDPKGELFEKTAAFRQKEGHKIVRFEPAASDSMTWNPFSILEMPESWEGKIAYVDRIANTLMHAGKNGDDYWTREARGLFVFFALFLISQNKETSLPEIRSFALSYADPQGFVSGILESHHDLPQRIKEEGNGILAKSSNEFSGVFGTFKSFLNAYGDAFIAKNTQKSDFCLKDLRKQFTSIYLVVKNSDQSRLRPFATLFFELATLALIHDEPTENEKKVTFYLDEFVRLGNMPEVLQMPAISRSFKVNVIFVVQSMSQVVDIYGEAGANQLKNTCAYHVIFAQNERKIAEDISSSIGKHTRKRVSFSSQSNRLLRGLSESEEGVPLILPQEIMSLPAFEILLLVQNHFQTPVKAKAAVWFKNWQLKKRVATKF